MVYSVTVHCDPCGGSVMRKGMSSAKKLRKSLVVACGWHAQEDSDFAACPKCVEYNNEMKTDE